MIGARSGHGLEPIDWVRQGSRHSEEGTQGGHHPEGSWHCTWVSAEQAGRCLWLAGWLAGSSRLVAIFSPRYLTEEEFDRVVRPELMIGPSPLKKD